MRIELFDYDLPEDLIAQEPAARRDGSRLLVLDRGAGAPLARSFTDLPALLRAGDLLVVNDAMVTPLRLDARRASGGAVEILLLRSIDDASDPPCTESLARGRLWEAMVRGGKRLRVGEVLSLGPDPADEITIGAQRPGGRRLVELPEGRPTRELIETWGRMPLPPYIRRGAADDRRRMDDERYQTVYARSRGAVAAPTAGLHFTPELIERLERVGVQIAALTLQVGPGTFQPVRVEEVRDHRMEAERYVLPEACVDAIVATRARGGRIIGVGTTVVRTLEHAARNHGGIEGAAGEGSADVFIYPGFAFGVIDAMLTNFHLPRSTPILLVAALAGRERLLNAYEFAVRERFRFYSYGDAMLVT